VEFFATAANGTSVPIVLKNSLQPRVQASNQNFFLSTVRLGIFTTCENVRSKNSGLFDLTRVFQHNLPILSNPVQWMRGGIML